MTIEDNTTLIGCDVCGKGFRYRHMRYYGEDCLCCQTCYELKIEEEK